MEKVFSAAAEDYIQEGLEAMSRLGGTVLLQVGTGPNGWSSCDPERYIQAFRQIARQTRQYDNIEGIILFRYDQIFTSPNSAMTVEKKNFMALLQ